MGAADNQTQVGIKVFQGEREMAADNQMLGQFDLVGIPPAPRGVPQIEVTFDIDANGMVNVGAVDKGTGKQQSITIRSSGGLSDAEVERMVQEAEQMRESDAKKKDTVTAKNDGETLGYQVEKQLSELKEKMSKEDADDLRKKMEDLRTFMTGDDVELEELKEKTKVLQEQSWKVTQQVYQSASSDESEQKKEEWNAWSNFHRKFSANAAWPQETVTVRFSQSGPSKHLQFWYLRPLILLCSLNHV